MKTSTALLLTLPLFLSGCSDEGSSTNKEEEVEGTTKEDYDALAGTEWVIRDPGTMEVDQKHRLKIEKDGDSFHVMFSGARADRVGHSIWPRNWAADVMRYDCEFEMAAGQDRLGCVEQGRAWEWCMPALTMGQPCTLEMLQAMDKNATEKDLEEAIALAEADIQRETMRHSGLYEDVNQQFQELWNVVFKTDRSKLGIEFMGDDVLKMRDTFTNFALKEVEDDLVADTQSGITNDRNGWEAIPYEKGDLLWENCDVERRYISLSDEKGFPENPFKEPHNPQDRASYSVGTELTFTHSQPSYDVLGSPKERLDPGCTFEFDAYHQGVLVEAGMKGEVKTVKDPRTKKDRAFARLQWTHTFDKPSPNPTYHPDVVTLVITKQCPGKEAEKLVSCQNLDIQP
jgi:hypothetical protein